MSLPASLATPFGLVFHELATNAAKYGSLSTPDGIVNLTWSVTERNGKRVLTVVWREQQGPEVKPPQRTGFGGTLIKRGIPHSTVDTEFRPDGLICTIGLSLPDKVEDGTPDEA